MSDVVVDVQLADDPVVSVQLAEPPAVTTYTLTGPQGPQGAAGPPGADAEWLVLTQAEYDLLVPKDPNTLYVIIG